MYVEFFCKYSNINSVNNFFFRFYNLRQTSSVRLISEYKYKSQVMQFSFFFVIYVLKTSIKYTTLS